ncbi:trp operon leader peptide [Salmonella enterica]|nr:trp operon leader peptide [Salmonella enterica subsp. salamae]EHC8752439.1 trp operon leader peptide [Salmonella enterica]EEN5166364.1 trp operon leader peptide [Salmonella enterica subsp. salamae]EHC8756922.1 trp operon leader peptide [Salmonella enterica]EHC8811663.1 trp operon leader peptide [Salmonella enterica]
MAATFVLHDWWRTS